MGTTKKQAKKGEKRPQVTSATSAVLGGDTLVEQLYDAKAAAVSFAVWRDGNFDVVQSVESGRGEQLVPYRANNNLLRNNVVLFPSEPEAYGDTKELSEEITWYLYQYVDLDPGFAEICAAYVLLSWVYDRFNELPYLRVRGDYGSGKTRFLLTLGSICYRPIFASGASTVAPLFHILDQIGGTLLIDEADFRFSDQTADITKILNNGNAKGFPVLRCETVQGNEYRPRSYSVFGPKLVATRNDYNDAALESRFITENMGLRSVRADIALNLPDRHVEDALRLRNKLLLFRFQNYWKYQASVPSPDDTLELRTVQTLAPLLSIIDDDATRNRIVERARREAEERRVERSTQIEAHVLEAIVSLREKESLVSIAEITKIVSSRHGENYDRRITPKWIGSIVRTRLRLATRKAHGTYVLAENQDRVIDVLRYKYDV